MPVKSLMILFGVLMLGACSSTDTRYPRKAELADVKQICIRNTHETRLPALSEALIKSLKKQSIQAKVVDQPKNAVECPYLLQARVHPYGELLNRSTFILRKNSSPRPELMSVAVYMRRGVEKQIAAEQGLQGQTDRVVALLLNKPLDGKRTK